MLDLKEKHCEPCEGGTPPFTPEEINEYRKDLAPGWIVSGNRKLQKSFRFKNFKQSMAFAQNIAAIAEDENHHPDLGIHYNNVEVELSTHAINGLSENDFIMAAKIDNL